MRSCVLGLVTAVALVGAARADDVDLCGGDDAVPAARADACTRLLKSGKYRDEALAVILDQAIRDGKMVTQDDLIRAQGGEPAPDDAIY